MVQLADDPLKVPTEEVPVADLPVLVRAVDRLVRPILMDGASTHQTGGVGDAAAAEAVREDLIGHPLAEPGGDGLLPLIDGELIGPQLRPAAVQPLQHKGVPDQAHIGAHVQRPPELVHPQPAVHPGEGDGLLLVVPALEPGGEPSPGKAPRPGRAEGKGHPSPRGDRAVWIFEVQVPGVKNNRVGHRASLQYGGYSAGGRPSPPSVRTGHLPHRGRQGERRNGLPRRASPSSQ